MGGENICLLF